MKSRRFGSIAFGIAALALAAPIACTRAPQNPNQEVAEQEAAQARRIQQAAGPSAIVSPDTANTVRDVNTGKVQVQGKARIGILYFLDQPAHRAAVLDWLDKNHASVLFEDQYFGYVDAELDWKDLGKLIATVSNLGLDESSVLKLELETVAAKSAADDAGNGSHNARARGHVGASLPDGGPAVPGNTSLFGPVHSAGYGAHVAEFRQKVAADLGIDVDHVAGQGSTVAVFDAGIDLSRTDVFQNRIQDFLIGDERLWKEASTQLADFETSEHVTEAPLGLEDIKDNSTLRIAGFSEKELKFDLNGNGTKDDTIAVAVYEKDGHLEARVRPAKDLAFGDALRDFSQGPALGRPQIVNLYTGKLYERAPTRPSPSAAAFKLRKDENGKVYAAMVGTANGSDHGISNLHMVGGDFTDATHGVRYQGVAPAVSFLGVQTWKLDGEDYGRKWLPLARGIIRAAEAKADVIDLDIYTPGTRASGDLLSKLLCRVVATTQSVPVVAAHNYGPLPDTVQSLAQSPCVLGIGASHSIAALRDGRNSGSIDPALGAADDAVQTANYSGRGFGMNGMLKPDVIAPAYGYTAYGAQFIRFGGTSGATPTTAGMIALLKQAARLKDGGELGFHQVRFLLQGSSREPGAQLVRDGYGHADLAAAWELYKKLGRRLTPFALSGNPYLEFDGRPDRRVIPITLTREAMHGSVNTPVSFKLWIEYGGQSPSGSSWLKFYDTPSATVSETLSKDMPMHGETQKINLMIDLPDSVWNALPPGDHVALVKGVRADLADGRQVDFLLPVAFTKGEDVVERTYDIKPLFADQYQIWSFNAEPGDQFFISGQPRCLGDAVPAAPGAPQTALYLNVDNEATYAHASWVMDSYAPAYLDPMPTRVIARKRIVRINLNRYGQMNCDGPMGGTITVRRSGFRLGGANVLVEASSGKQQISLSAPVSSTGTSLLAPELNRGLQWKFHAKDSRLTLRKLFDAETVFTVPAGTREIRVVPADPAHFQAVLASIDKDGKVADQASTQQDDSGAFSSGFASLALRYNGSYSGLGLSKPDAGNTVKYVPSEKDDGKANSKATIEIDVDLPDAASVALTTQDAIASWAADDVKTVGFKATVPAQIPDALKDFVDWNIDLAIDASVQESMANGNDDAGYIPLDLWTGTLRAPLFFR